MNIIQIILILSTTSLIGFVIAAVLAFKQLKSNKKIIAKIIIDDAHIVYKTITKYELDILDLYNEFPIYHIVNKDQQVLPSIPCVKTQQPIKEAVKPTEWTASCQLEYA